MLKKSIRMCYFKKLWPYLSHYKFNLFILFFVKMILIIPDLMNVYLFRILIDYIIARSNTQLLPFVISGYIGVFVFSKSFQAIQLCLTNKLNSKLKISIRKEVFNKILHMNISKIYSYKTADLKMNLSDDIDFLEKFITSQFIDYVLYYIKVLIYFVALLNLNVFLTAIMSLSVPIFLLITKKIRQYSAKISEKVRITNVEYDNWLLNSLNGWKEIKTNSFIGRENEQFHLHWERKKAASINESVIWYLNRTALSIKDFLITNVLLYALGGVFIIYRYFSIGGMLIFVNYFQSFFNFINTINDLQLSINLAKPIIDRIFTILDDKSPECLDVSIESQPISYQFEHVGFYYQKDRGYILEDINLILNEYDKILIVGESGVGKSTLVKLMLNIYQPQVGSIKLNGIDINQLPQKKYHQMIGAYLQDSVLFNMSIYDNLVMAAKNADISNVISACKLANIHDHIQSLPDGYNTIIDENGSNFSGGQIQRIAIARLILQDPKIIILDEATISLDPKTEKLILEMIKNQFSEKMVLMISHRKEHLKYVDRVITLSKGQVIDNSLNKF